MSLDSKHPLYAEAFQGWRTLRDFYEGEDAVKDKGEAYLPATSGMRIDGMGPGQDGEKDYKAYKSRAVVPDYVKEAVEILLGLLHQKEPTIELPPELEPLRERCTINGEPLNTLLKRINIEQLIPGRLGLLTDLPQNPDQTNPLPYIALYVAESIINWDDNSEQDGVNALNLVVLDESKKIRIGFEWRDIKQYRVLQLGNLLSNEAEGTATYKQGLFSSNDASSATYVEGEMITPVLRGKTLTHIPFVFVNTKDILAVPDKPPLQGLCEIVKAIYKLEADYRQNLHMQSQDTLVVVGGVRQGAAVEGQPDVLRTGAGTRIDVDQGGDAKYIGVSSAGLSEQRLAIENDRKRATIKAGELIQSGHSQQESGVALQTRFTAQTATLNQIADIGAVALEKSLKTIAEWMGADASKVKVTPNKEFVDFGLDGLNFVNIMQAKKLGLPISFQSIHAILADRGMTIQDFVTETKTIEEENKNLLDVVIPPVALPDPAALPADPTKPTPAQPAKKAPAAPVK